MKIITFFIIFSIFVYFISNASSPSNVYFKQSDKITIDKIPYSIATGDFNNDGKPDIVSTHFYDGIITVSLGNGNGTFSQWKDYQVTLSFSRVTHVYTVDLNHDNLMDILVTSGYEDGRVAIFTADEGDVFIRRPDVLAPRYCDTLGFGDFDNDGDCDFVVNGFAGNFVTINYGNGSGNFTRSNVVITLSMSDCVSSGDINRDGLTDIFVGCVSNYFPTVSIF